MAQRPSESPKALSLPNNTPGLQARQSSRELHYRLGSYSELIPPAQSPTYNSGGPLGPHHTFLALLDTEAQAQVTVILSSVDTPHSSARSALTDPLELTEIRSTSSGAHTCSSTLSQTSSVYS